MRTRTVRNGAVDLAVYEQGDPDGPTIVAVHGWPDTHELWDRVVADLAGSFRVITFDNRGAGASTVPTDVDSYRIDELAGDLFAVIDAVSPDSPVHVLAHDWGSVVGWEAVVTKDADRRIASFTSVSGPSLDHLGAWTRAQLTSRKPTNIWKAGTQAVASAYTVAFQVPGLPNPVLKVMSKRWPQFLARHDGLDPTLVSTADTLPNDMIASLKLYRANIRTRLRRPSPRTTDIPVQLIVSARDRAVRPVIFGDTEKWVSNLRRQEIDAGHWSPISHASELAAFTAQFVRDLESVGTR